MARVSIGDNFHYLTVKKLDHVNTVKREKNWLCSCKCGNTNIYRVWSSMLDRCSNVNSQSFKNYGGRGIKVCKRWYKFENFLGDMGKPKKNLSIDRINNNKSYSPSNCKWSSYKEQNRNNRRNIVLEYNGDSGCLAYWAEKLKVNYYKLYSRYRRGLATEKILLT